MNGKQARRLRRVAEDMAVEDDRIVNVNIQTKTMKSGRMVMNDRAAMVEELVPIVTYTSEYEEDSPRNLYKALKGDYYDNNH